MQWLFDRWVYDKDKANLVCHNDDDSVLTDVEIADLIKKIFNNTE
ncbi:MAG: hypothetical protein ACE5SW_10080 [Nitrososphaeraceae archaeon]